MVTFFTILIMTFAVSLSQVCTRMLPFRVPLPFMQIAIGALLAWPAFGLHVAFDPELFLVLFIPPLLFADGRQTSTREFFDQSREIFSLALLLALLSVIGMGGVIHCLIPNIPIAPAFALAAVLSPTDAIALSGIVGEGRIPKKIMDVLQGEALMNDASGLVSLKFAVAVTTGTMVFTIGGATIEFLGVAVGGILAGIVVSWFVSRFLRFLNSREGDEPATQIVLLFLLPFASYLVAEHIGVSGVLASVTAGMTITRVGVMRHAPLVMRMRANSTWKMLEFVFNGMVFLLLGLQLPEIFDFQRIVPPSSDNETWVLFSAIAMIYAGLLLFRVGWLWAMTKFSRSFLKKNPMEFSSWTTRELLIASFSGVRGTITLAGVLSIPLLLPDGNPFPSRYELVFLATGVILLSLLAGAIIVPMLLQNLGGTDFSRSQKEVQIARIAPAEAAIDAVRNLEGELREKVNSQLLSDVSSCVIGYIRHHAGIQKNTENSLQEKNLEQRFLMTALHAERTELYHRFQSREISNETLLKQLHELDLLEALLLENRK